MTDTIGLFHFLIYLKKVTYMPYYILFYIFLFIFISILKGFTSQASLNNILLFKINYYLYKFFYLYKLKIKKIN